MTQHSCECAVAGYCKRRKRHVSGLGLRACQGGHESYFRNAEGDEHSPELATHLAPVRFADGTRTRAVAKAWEGNGEVKPWDHRTTVAMVHLDTPDLLEVALDLWALQDERAHFVVVDTGSLPQHQEMLDRLEHERPNLEIHRLRPRAWRAISQPVAAAMDVAFAVCQTEYLVATHTDVFPTRRDLLSWVVGQCDDHTPLVGWQMSPRPAWPDDRWKVIPSHTCTAYHMPTARALGWRWNMLTAFDVLDQEPHQPRSGFPDTEVLLGLLLADQGITPRRPGDPNDDQVHWLCLGPEDNAPYETDYFVHQRNTTVQNVYGIASTVKRADELQRVVAEARARVQSWRAEPPAKPPGLLQQLGTFAAAAATHVVAGCPSTPVPERQRRMTICRSCAHFDADKSRCLKCGCRMRTKTAWSLTECPLGKW